MAKTFGVFKRRDAERIGAAVSDFEKGRDASVDRRRLVAPDAASVGSQVQIFRLKAALNIGSVTVGAPQVWTGPSPSTGAYVDASSDPTQWVALYDRLGVFIGIAGDLCYAVLGGSGGWEIIQKVRVCT